MGNRYAVRWEDRQVVAIVVSGVEYSSPDQIENLSDRAAILELIAKGPEALNADLDAQFSSFIDAELQHGASVSALRIVFPIFMAIAIVLLLISAALGLRTRQGLWMGRTVSGEVVEMIQRQDDQGNTFFYPVVEFPLPDGQVQTVEVAEGTWPAPYETGEMVTVYYDPKRPLQARIQSDSANAALWLGSLITGTLGIAFLAIILTVRRMLGATH